MLTKNKILDKAYSYYNMCKISPDEDEIANYVLDVYGYEGLEIIMKEGK